MRADERRKARRRRRALHEPGWGVLGPHRFWSGAVKAQHSLRADGGRPSHRPTPAATGVLCLRMMMRESLRCYWIAKCQIRAAQAEGSLVGSVRDSVSKPWTRWAAITLPTALERALSVLIFRVKATGNGRARLQYCDVLGRTWEYLLYLAVDGGSTSSVARRVDSGGGGRLCTSQSDVPGRPSRTPGTKGWLFAVGAQSPTRLQVARERWTEAYLFGRAICRWGLRVQRTLGMQCTSLVRMPSLLGSCML
jgi:hypothetical protein